MIMVDDKELVVSGWLVNTARLRDEYYVFIDDPDSFLRALAARKIRADLFTFLQRPGDPTPRYNYAFENEHIAALKIDTYDKWWKEQINDKTRNMVRKAGKKGVVIRPLDFTDDLVRGIKIIYDESPIRQGRPFKHYGKDLETLRREHATFLDRSEFIGAFLGNELIAFIKLVHQDTCSSLMQIIALMSHRDKAPTNALIAKAVEACAARNCRLLHYGTWSRRSIGDFKMHHGFEPLAVPRYFVPLGLPGRSALRLKLHRDPASWIPGPCVDVLATLRAKWRSQRHSP